ncbi:MAG: acyl-CoA/acyl-ACP dehydrogenase [Deltaproteobacteria bacterium]|nr:acyl-CoA/acyl-ACP dehydrogenase [Deltaproteobacteria bacterium]MBW2085135.1 acyl-CoA/acyl-ACP dehydrogenase [Deltaproteobacteria bacterium]
MDYFPLIVTEQDKMIAQVIRKFVDQEIMPVRDKIDDDTDHVLINEILSKLDALGLFQAGSRSDEGGDAPRPTFVTNCIVIEEMSRGDAGIGMVAVISGWAMAPAITVRNREVMELFQSMAQKKSPCLACFAMTEPASGCDVENLPELHGRTIATRAVQDGDYWVINGAKRFPSSAGVSSLYCVACQADPEKGEEGIALIYVPADVKGLSFGKFEMKAGLQADRNADIFFDDVRVPLSYRASGPGRDAELLKSNLTNGRVGTAAAAIGVAKATFEEVLKYTGERVVAGKPIREHSIAAGILAEMAMGIEIAQAHCLQAAYMLSHPEEFGPPHSDAMLCQASITKNYATEMAIMVTNKAMELMGSYGYIRDYHVEKYWRDVKELQLWLGGAQLGRFDVVRGYYPYKKT